jgi:glucose-1-phosphate adenylyltransferase
MNYEAMLEAHKQHDADLTVAVLDVPIEEASRFGIMSVDADMMITAFAEKPAKPTSTLASMGIYIFTYKV